MSATQDISTTSASKLLTTTSPALFARTASHGRWQMARHLMLVDRALTDIATGRIKRLVVEMPPRHGKSELISRFFPAWYLGTFPDRKVILCSYGDDLASDFGLAARRIMEEFGPKYFGVSVATDRASRNDWRIEGREGGMVSAGVGGPITGKGANLFVVDDYCKNAEEALSESWRRKTLAWWQSTAYTRSEPDAAIVVMATRWHKDDLIGHLLSGDEKWVRIRIPAIAHENDPLRRAPGEPLWPERWPKESLEKIRQAIGPAWWAALYDQDPTIHEGAEWPASYFGDDIWANRWPDAFDISAMACDPSKGRDRGDYSAIVFVGKSGGLWWIDANVKRRPVERIVMDFLGTYARLQPFVVGCEANAFQDLLAAEMQRQITANNLPPITVHKMDNRVNKALRISRLGAYLEQGLLRIRDNEGGRLLVSQLQEFPLGDHDDGPDALEMALRLVGAQQFQSHVEVEREERIRW